MPRQTHDQQFSSTGTGPSTSSLSISVQKHTQASRDDDDDESCLQNLIYLIISYSSLIHLLLSQPTDTLTGGSSSARVFDG